MRLLVALTSRLLLSSVSSYFAPSDHNIPLLLADLHVFTSFRTVGLGVTTAQSRIEFFLSTVMIFIGYYLYGWKLSGLMQMFYLEKVTQSVSV